jgi:hypothetical protein
MQFIIYVSCISRISIQCNVRPIPFQSILRNRHAISRKPATSKNKKNAKWKKSVVDAAYVAMWQFQEKPPK